MLHVCKKQNEGAWYTIHDERDANYIEKGIEYCTVNTIHLYTE